TRTCPAAPARRRRRRLRCGQAGGDRAVRRRREARPVRRRDRPARRRAARRDRGAAGRTRRPDARRRGARGRLRVRPGGGRASPARGTGPGVARDRPALLGRQRGGLATRGRPGRLVPHGRRPAHRSGTEAAGRGLDPPLHRPRPCARRAGARTRGGRVSAPAAQTAQTMQTAPAAADRRGPASPGPDAVRADLIAAAAQQLTGTDQGQRLARARRGEVCGALAPETGVRIEAWGPATTVLLMPGTSLTRPPEVWSEAGDASVAVVVVDGSVPLGADELAVLAGLALPAAQVVLVVDRGAGPAAEGERDGVRAASRA